MSDWTWLAASFILGVIAAVFALKAMYGQRLGRAETTCIELQRRESQLDTERGLLREQLDEIKSTEALLRMELSETSLSNTRLQTLFEESRKLYEEQQKQFEQIGNKTLKALKDEMETKAARDYTERQTMLDEKFGTLLKPLKELIEQNDKRVKEIEKQHTEDTASLKKHIELIVGETSKLVTVKNKLADALSNSKGRGDWGEMELIRLLEESGLSAGIHYEAQKQEDGLRPDITIKLSNQRILYVDAKTILVNLERLCNAGDTEEEMAERKKHAAALEKEVLSLSAKAYQTKCKESIDFVVLYVPRESMLRAALEEKPALMEQAFQKRVILASPLILMSILKTVSYGWEQAQLSQKAQEIHALGKELHKRAATFVERFDRLGKTLESVGVQYEEASRSLLGRQGVVPQLKKFESYGCKSEKTLVLTSAEQDDDAEDIADGEIVAEIELLTSAESASRKLSRLEA